MPKSESSPYALSPRSSRSFDEEPLLPTQTRFKPQQRCHRGTAWVLRNTGSLISPYNAFKVCAAVFALLVVLTPLVRPSYTYRPIHYTGTNPHSEKVFIAACIVDPNLIRGAWGKAVVDLINIIGPENTFLSIYENDSGSETKLALQELSTRLPCEHSIVSEHLPLEQIPHILLPSEEERVRRITYLAEVRNRAMRPLYDGTVSNSTTLKGRNASDEIRTEIDKVLFLNDVVFSARDAADLLFATRAGPDLRTNYRAACAVDFMDPVKFYDTFATRDLEGNEMGAAFFPWFSNAGNSESRQDVLDGKDSVRVQSCWGGMVAFEAKWFGGSATHQETLPGLAPIRFRGEEELFWEASESCLIHADLQAQAKRANVSDTMDPLSYGTGIFLNPFIRVAYSESAFQWLEFSRRFEHLYSVPHRLVTWLAGLPKKNPRVHEEEGQEVTHMVWTNAETSMDGNTVVSPWNSQDGCYQETTVEAQPGGYCGRRQLAVLRTHREAGEKMWEKIRTPPLDQQCGQP